MTAKSRKQIAAEFLNLTSKGNSQEAFGLYAHDQFIHHNVFFKGDKKSLMLAMEENAKQFPNIIFEIKHSLEDGDLVSCHSHAKLKPDEPGYALTHIFRFEGDKIVELWDFGQAVPAEMVNENGMF